MLCPIMVQSRARGTANDPIPPHKRRVIRRNMEPYPLPSVAGYVLAAYGFGLFLAAVTAHGTVSIVLKPAYVLAAFGFGWFLAAVTH
jgi:hypothetical protein